MKDRIRTFRNVRARVLRTEEGLWHSGWTKHMAHDEARIRLKSFTAFAVGTRVIGECYGDGTLVRFAGLLTGQMGQEIAVQICGSLGFERHHEAVRIGVEGVFGMLNDEEATYCLAVTDVSPESLGGMLDRSVRVGAFLDLQVNSPLGEIEGRVSVVYCKAVPEGGYRVGLRIIDVPRLDSARWARFVVDMAAA